MTWTFYGEECRAQLIMSCQNFLKMRLTPVYHILTVVVMQEPVYQQKAPPSQYFPKYLSPSVRPLKPDIAATGFRINLTPDVPVSAVAVTLASVVFRLQVSWSDIATALSIDTPLSPQLAASL